MGSFGSGLLDFSWAVGLLFCSPSAGPSAARGCFLCVILLLSLCVGYVVVSGACGRGFYMLCGVVGCPGNLGLGLLASLGQGVFHTHTYTHTHHK